MNGPGNIGQARKIHTPSLTEIGNALHLIAAIGGDNKGEVTQLLRDLKAAAEHNERLLRDVSAGLQRLSDLAKREAEVNRIQAETDEKIDKINAILAETEVIFAEELENG
jgi:hypothetical protein